MASKFICVVLLVFALMTSIFGSNNMLDPLYSFLSANPITVGIRLAIVASLFAVIFSQRTLKPPFRMVIKAFSAFLITFGMTTLLSNSLGYVLYNYIMPLDSVIMIEAGIVFALAVLSTSEVHSNQKGDVKKQKALSKAE